MEEIEPIRVGHEQSEELGNIVRDDTGLTFRRDVEYVLLPAVQEELATALVSSDKLDVGLGFDGTRQRRGRITGNDEVERISKSLDQIGVAA